MAESVIVVCDVCGAPAEEGVIIRIGGRNLAKDLCAAHLRELIAGTHTPKRGRRPGSTSKRRRGPKSTSSSGASRAKRSAARGRRKAGRPKRSAAKSAA